VSRKSVLIAGAGIAGPALAYWLRERGFEPTIVERAQKFRTGGYVIDFWGVGYDVAERMGLRPFLQDVGYANDRAVFVNCDGSKRSEIGGNTLRRALGNRFVSIQRGDLAGMIFAMVADKTETIFGDEIFAIEEREERVEVTFRRGSMRSFDYIVGADGLRSTVRTRIFMDTPVRQFLGYYAASFVAEEYPRRDEGIYLSFAAPGRQVSRYALRDGKTGFLFVLRSDERLIQAEHDVAAQIDLLCRTFDRDGWEEWPEIRRRLESCTDLYFDAVSQVHLPAWSKGRIALVGDAAYCPSLLAGEGAAFAMAGAYILAGELGRMAGDHAAAFQNYERKFRPFIEQKQRSARRFAGSFAPRTQLGLFVRDAVLRLSALPAVADWLMARYVKDAFTLPDY